MVKSMKYYWILIFILLSGCSIGAVPYKTPSGNNKVDFTVKNRLAYSMFVHAYNDAVQCKGRSIISFLQPSQSEEVEISTEKEFAFSLLALVPNSKFCRMMVTFSPEEGNEYFATMDYDQPSNKCLLTLNQKNEKGLVREVASANLRARAGFIFDESSSFCQEDK